MPGHEHDALADHLVGNRDSLLGVAGVIADLELQLLAENAAGGIEVGNSLRGAGPHLLAKRGVLARHRSCSGDHDVGLGRTGHRQAERKRQPCYKVFLHGYSLSIVGSSKNWIALPMGECRARPLPGYFHIARFDCKNHRLTMQFARELTRLVSVRGQLWRSRQENGPERW